MRKKCYLKILLIFCLFFCNIYFVSASNFCQNEDIAKIIKYINLFVNIIRVAVPIILIISAMLKLLKAVTGKDGIDGVKKVLVTNVIAAVLIFLIPTFVEIVIRISGSYEDYKECLDLAESPIKNNPTNNLEYYPSITKISHTGAFVTVNAKKGNNSLAGYYFSKSSKKPTGKEANWVPTDKTKLELVLLPGKYYVYVKDSENRISKSTKITITWDEVYENAVQSRSGKNNPIVGDLSNILSSSFGKYNDFIATSVRAAGLFTREGVAVAGLAAQEYLHKKYNIHISYVSNIHCFGQRYNVNFGANPKWGHIITMKEITRGEPRQKAEEVGIGE